MLVYVLASSFPSDSCDAAGRFVLEWCELLRDAGHEVRVFTWGRESGWAPHGIPIERVSYLPGERELLFDSGGAPDILERQWWRAFEAPLAAVSLLHAVLRHPPPDLFVGHWLLPCGVLARVCGDATRRPSLVVGHSAGVHLVASLPHLLRQALTSYVAREGTTTVSSAALRAKLGADVDVLPMGYNPPGAAPSSNGEDLLCFGRLEPIKGFDIVVDALASLDGPPTVHFAGDGTERARLEAGCARERLDARFWGWVDAATKAEVFPRCAVAAFASRVLKSGRHEGWPVSVLEVSSMGVIPLVGPWPGADEMVVRPDLQVVADYRAHSWANAITRLYALPMAQRSELRDATLRHAARYTWEALRPRWIETIAAAGRR